MDLETTGLDPRKDDILEVAFAIADLSRPFHLLDSIKSWVTIYRWDSAYWDPKVRAMHTENGLIAEATRSTTYVNQVERELLPLVPLEADYNDKPVLAGSSVHFDLSFLRNCMPSLAMRLSHRTYDVSAVKLFCRSLGMPKLPRAEAHRASADILESIVHAQSCVEWLTQRCAPTRLDTSRVTIYEAT